ARRRADHGLPARRRLARRRCTQPGLRGRNVRERRRPFRRTRLRGGHGRGARRHGGPSAPRGGVGGVERRELRWRPRAYLRRWPLLRRPPCCYRPDRRLGQGLGAARRSRQRRPVHQRNVRPQARAAVRALVLCEVRRPPRARAEPDPPSLTAALPRGGGVRDKRLTRVPAPVTRVGRGAAGDRRAAGARRGRRVEPLRAAGDARRFAEPAWTGGAGGGGARVGWRIRVRVVTLRSAAGYRLQYSTGMDGGWRPNIGLV